MASVTFTGSALPPTRMFERLSPVLFTRRNAAWWFAGDEGLAVHHEQPHVTVVGVGQHLLGDHVAVAPDRLDHLVEVGGLVARHEEHAACRPSPAAA